jgi:hypothetical protein
VTIPVLPGFAAGAVPNPAGVKTWRDRVREAAFTSPSGTRIRFQFEDVGREWTKRGTIFEFAGVDGGYVQQTGNGPLFYPMQVFFSGKDCDLIATAFEAALLEDGIGKLEHPMYRKLDVVPFGPITRRDALVSGANQVTIDVTFFRTLGAVWPSSQAHPQSEILAAIAGFNVAAAQQFEGRTKLTRTLQKVGMIATLKKLVGNVNRALSVTRGNISSITRQFREAEALANFMIDTAIGQPLAIAGQISNLIQAPARALTGIEQRLGDYDRLAKDILASALGAPDKALASGQGIQDRIDKIGNDFHAAAHVAMNAVAGSVIAVSADPIGENGTERGALRRGAQFRTRTQAVEAAAALTAQFEQLIPWREGGFAALAGVDQIGPFQVDTGEDYQALQRAVALASGALLQVSFTLVPERAIVLDRNRTIIDLAAQLYGKVDNDTLDFLISTNNLTGDEILELPRGREILYYPEPKAA